MFLFRRERVEKSNMHAIGLQKIETNGKKKFSNALEMECSVTDVCVDVTTSVGLDRKTQQGY